MFLAIKRPGALPPGNQVAMLRNRIWLLAGLAVLALTGCGKPPGCSDSETLNLMTSSIINEVRPRVDKFTAAGDPDSIMEKYIDSIKVELRQAVSRGYDEDAKLQSCGAQLTVKTLSGVLFEREIQYSTQRTADGDDFVLRMSHFDLAANYTVNDAIVRFRNARYVGAWRGTLQCGELDGVPNAATGEPNGYTQPVLIQIKGAMGEMKRLTPAGYIEEVIVRIEPDRATFSIFGAGGPRDPSGAQERVLLEVNGNVSGRNLTGKGFLQNGDNKRACTLEATQGATSPEPGPAVLAAMQTPMKAAQPGTGTGAPTEACVEDWVRAFRKGNGDEAAIRHDMIAEWESWCRQRKKPN